MRGYEVYHVCYVANMESGPYFVIVTLKVAEGMSAYRKWRVCFVVILCTLGKKIICFLKQKQVQDYETSIIHMDQTKTQNNCDLVYIILHGYSNILKIIELSWIFHYS